MKRAAFLLFVLLCAQVTVSAQSESFQEYAKRQQQAQAQFIQTGQENLKKFRDSLNQQYAEYLAEEWKSFNLSKSGPLLKDPIRKPPVFDGNAPQPQPDKLPVVTPLPAPVPQQLPQPGQLPGKMPQLKPQLPVHKDSYPLKSVFFGTGIGLKKIPAPAVRLSGVSEKEVSAYWAVLAGAPGSGEWAEEVLRLADERQLNDWAVVRLVDHLFSVYFPQGSENEQAVFSVFVLNQLGYRAKIGRNGHELMPLIAFQQTVHNAAYLTNSREEGVKYTVINPKRKDISAIQTCQMDYEGAQRSVDMSLAGMPDFAVNLQTKVLQGKPVRYNRNIVDFCETYPCVDFPVYAGAALDETLWESIEELLAPELQGKSQEEAVNALLHFVQHAFQYKTDEEQFGREKWFFAEETIASAFSDCEDRSILFTQLVHRLLRMPVVLVYYPGRHLATAVKFGNSATTGDYFTVNGEKYLICDPTYVNADLGMAMPDLRNIPVEILPLSGH